MYNFVDTTEVSEGALLPSEALKINGEYIENLISGYRTLTVSGREALSPEIEYTETGIKDGATLKSRRFPARIITVQYQIIAESAEAFRQAYNKLAAVLNVENAELIFNDEPDKFFTGTPSAIGEVEPGRNAVTGEFEIFCADPFKYSVTEYEVEPTNIIVEDEEGNVTSEKSFEVEYNGTYKAFPKLVTQFFNETEISEDGETSTALTGNGDCGFVAFLNEHGKILQLGDPDEVHGEDFAPSQTLINQSFKKSNSWGTAAKSLWTINNGKVLNDVAQNGTIHITDAKEAENNDYYLKANSHGSGSKWHGATITRAIPVDATNETGATNFKLTYSQKLAISSNTSSGQKQMSMFQALCVNVENDVKKVVAGVNIYKAATGKTGTYELIINDKIVRSGQIDLSYGNINFGYDKEAKKSGVSGVPVKTSSITKESELIQFNIGSLVFSYVDESIKDTPVNEITFVFAKYGSKPAMVYNGIYDVKFVKNNCTDWRNIPNKFGANDILIADCNTGKITLNNANHPEYGALGNDWEEFFLQPGTNKISIAYSDWITEEYAPTFKLRYREVFL